MSTEMFFRLFSRAPRTWMLPKRSDSEDEGDMVLRNGGMAEWPSAFSSLWNYRRERPDGEAAARSARSVLGYVSTHRSGQRSQRGAQQISPQAASPR